MKIALTLCLFVTLFSCSRQATGPEQILTTFINYRFSKGQTREKLIEMTSGKLRQSIREMSQESFEAFSNMPIKKKRFKILTTKCGEEKCSISYFIKYEAFQGNEKVFAIEIKKITTLENIDGKWKISDVSNVKEFYDAARSIDIIGN